MISDSSFSVRIRGIAEIERAMFQLNARLGEQINLLACRKAANYMLKEIRAAAPVSKKGSQERDNTGRGIYTHFPPGRLKRALKIKKSKINQIRKNGKTGVFITLSPGRKRNDPKGAWYGKFVEVGYNRGSRRIGSIEALASGIVSAEYLLNRRAQSLANQRRGMQMAHAGKRLGRVQSKMIFRKGGQHVEGQHFILNTFNRTAPAALAIMVEAAEVATAQVARQLNLNVRRH